MIRQFLYAVSAALAMLAAVALLAVAARPAAPPVVSGDGVTLCYPAHRWAPAPDRRRPCRAIYLYEDGSARIDLQHGPHGRVLRHCYLPAFDGGRPSCGGSH